MIYYAQALIQDNHHSFFLSLPNVFSELLVEGFNEMLNLQSCVRDFDAVGWLIVIAVWIS